MPGWLGYPERFPLERDIGYAFSTGASVFHVIDPLMWAPGNALRLLLLFLVLRTVLRSNLAATVVWMAVLSVIPVSRADLWVSLPLGIILAVFRWFVLFRLGLVALVVGIFVDTVFYNYPMTLGFSAWYSGLGFTALLVVIALALAGLFVSLEDRRLRDFA
jgi:hypothetical protein